MTTEAEFSSDALERLKATTGGHRRGSLHLYLGMAPGVGKTYAMLMEGRRLREEGHDVVVGFVETHGRAGTTAALGDLEVLPRRVIEYQGRMLEELNANAVIGRDPEIALIDELAHTNTPGSQREKRWQDVEAILDAGINVMSTVNIQHFESVAPLVEAITGSHVRERLPDSVLDQADRVELVDIAPEALRRRVESGEVYPAERAEQALREFFREGNLTALRELALRRLSTAVERDLEQYMRDHEIDATWAASERVLAIVEPGTADAVVRAAANLARTFQTELLVVDLTRSESVERLALDLGATSVREVPPEAFHLVGDIINDLNVGHVVVAGPRRGRLVEALAPSPVNRILGWHPGLQVHVVPRRRE